MSNADAFSHDGTLEDRGMGPDSWLVKAFRYLPVLVFVFPLLLGLLQACDTGDQVSPANPDWYKQKVFYEIFPRSFKDTNGDGIGDLKGVQVSLPYLADLGIGAIWLTPIYPTPFFDSGYDVADYEAINPDYGTMADFEELVQAAHDYGIRVMLDMVFNHTSIDHPWFQESRSSLTNPKRDWYYWSDNPVPFHCWDLTVLQFGFQQWTLDAPTNQKYFHRFYPQQPELNFSNPEVWNALLGVARFWLDKGVDGFRLDVPYMYYESADGCNNMPQTHQFLKALRALLDSYPDKTMVGEIQMDGDILTTYFGNGYDELQMVFNFALFPQTYIGFLLGSPSPLRAGLNQSSFNPIKPSGGRFAPFLDNHDFARNATFLLDNVDRIKLAATFLLTGPGTPFLYYGDEIGMFNGTKVVIDIRDTMRTPMQWNTDHAAGFTTGTPWLPLAADWENRNVAVETADPHSILQHYKNLIRLRNDTPELYSDDSVFVNSNCSSVFALLRGSGPKAVLVLLNMNRSGKSGTLDLHSVPWVAGQIRDLLSGVEVEPLTNENRGAYPFALNGSQGMILQPGTP